MKLKNILIFIIISSLFLSGCDLLVQPGNTNTNTGTVSTQEANLGISFEFVDAPTKINYYNDGTYDSISALVEINNKGRYPINQDFNGRIEFSGYDESIFKTSSTNPAIISKKLHGVSSINPDGTYDQKTFTIDDINLIEGAETLDLNIFATLDYEYATIANLMLCVSSVLENDQTKVCERNQVLTFEESQNAPIKVTQVEQIGGLNNNLVKIYIENIGNGRVISPEKFNNEKIKLEGYKDINEKIDISIEVDGIKDITCDPIRIELRDGKANTLCRFENPKDSNYPASTTITLKYYYEDTINRDIKIIKTNI